MTEPASHGRTPIGAWLDDHWNHAEHALERTAQSWFTRTPAQPENRNATKGKDMSNLIARLEEDVKTDLTTGLDWMEGFVARVKAAAPGIIATSEAVAGSTVGQIAEMFLGKILPPDVETELLSLVKRYVTAFGQPAQPVQPDGVAPVPAQ